jgi:hypothetical protein
VSLPGLAELFVKEDRAAARQSFLASRKERADVTIEVAQEFHRQMAAVVEAVQAGIWAAGMKELLAYSTDFGLGQSRGVQTLVLKTTRKSAYLRLRWDTILGDGESDRRAFDEAIRSAITELS